MRMTIEPTQEFADFEGKPARLWVGQAENGVRVIAWIMVVGVDPRDPLPAADEFGASLVLVPPAERIMAAADAAHEKREAGNG